MAARELQDLSEVDMRTEWRLRDSTDDRELDAVFWPPGERRGGPRLLRPRNGIWRALRDALGSFHGPTT